MIIYAATKNLKKKMKLSSEFSMDLYGLNVRLVVEEDAKFILNLRLDPELGNFMNKVSSEIDAQIEWIREYKKRELEGVEYYFIYSRNGLPLGVNRMTNIQNDSWMGASLIFKKDSGAGTPILASLIQYHIGFETLDKSIHFGDQLKDNNKAIRFNKFMGSDFIHEDENVFYIILSKRTYLKTKQKIEKMFLR